MADPIDFKEYSSKANVLHRFRSYTPIFTLSALSIDTIKNSTPNTLLSNYDKDSSKFTIAKTGGKGSEFIMDMGADSADLVNKFNKESPGRFDFFFDDAEIETLVAFDKRTGFAKATAIDFTIVEPYSIGAFMEAIQVSSVAAGFAEFKSAPFLLKLEFKGYLDTDTEPSGTAVSIDNTTRYFPFKFVNLDVSSNETGTKYKCKAVPFNELGLGQPNKLTANINISGTTVGPVLTILMNAVNNTVKTQSAKTETRTTNSQQFDEYRIVFPKVTNGNIADYTTDNYEKNDFFKYTVAAPTTDDIAYQFLNPSDYNGRTVVANNSQARTPSIQFAVKYNVHDCIAAILRDCKEIQDALAQIPNSLDADEMFNYFNISMEVTPKGVYDTVTGAPLHVYTYVVIPYKIHVSRIPGYQKNTANTKKLEKFVRRKYSYIYTGQNVDIIQFELNFNSLYFQTKAINNGDNNIDPASGAQAPQGRISVKETGESLPADLKKGTGMTPSTQFNIESADVNYSGIQTRGLQSNPYGVLVKNLHAAMLNNVSMIEVDLEIVGDPYFLVQGGIGNIKSKTDPRYPGMTTTGDADHQVGDIYVTLDIKNVDDITETGMVKFNKTASFSGLYRVISVASRFHQGQFTQKLKIIRTMGQYPIDTQVPPAPIKSDLIAVPYDPNAQALA